MKSALIDQYCGSSLMPGFPSGNDLGEEGLYYFNARWYDPQLGRFITEDPIKDGVNWYAYVANNPLIYTDPTGLVNIPFAFDYQMHDSAWSNNSVGYLKDAKMNKVGCYVNGLANAVSTLLNDKR